MTQRDKQRDGPPMLLMHYWGERQRAHENKQDMSLLHSTHRQVWVELGWIRSAVPSRESWPGRGTEVTAEAAVPGEDMHHAHRGQGCNHHPICLHETVDHADFSTMVSFIFASEVRRVHAFHWITLTED